jgi:general secretion pathway protein G
MCGYKTLRTRLCGRVVRPGFTLIEVMVVVVVITLLAALVAPNVFRNLGTAKAGTAVSQMEMLSAALDAYRLDNGRYPTTDQGLDALWTEPTLEPRPGAWNGPYLRKRVPLDPWGNSYIYRFPGQENAHGFDLLTYGADGRPAGEGDHSAIRAWE